MAQIQQSHRPPLRSVLEAYVNITNATYTAKAGDRVIGVNRSGAVTITLPSAQVRQGRVYTVKDESGAAAANNITVATEGSETIDGSATDTLSENYGSKTYYSDGSNWFQVPLLPTASHTTPAASTTAAGHAELATTAETDTGTDVATGDGKADFHVPSTLNGMNLVDVHAEVITAGTTNTTDIQIANVTQSADMLSTKLTIDSAESGSDTAAAAAVIDTGEDDVQTNDMLRIDVDAVSNTAPKGLIVTLTFRLP